MSNFLTRRLRREKAERAGLHRRIRELGYELSLLRTNGWRRKVSIFENPSGIYPVRKSDEGVERLKLAQFACTLEFDPEVVRHALMSMDELQRYHKRKAIDDIASKLIDSPAIHTYSQIQYGHDPKNRMMWSMWVGVPEGFTP